MASLLLPKAPRNNLDVILAYRMGPSRRWRDGWGRFEFLPGTGRGTMRRVVEGHRGGHILPRMGRGTTRRVVEGHRRVLPTFWRSDTLNLPLHPSLRRPTPSAFASAIPDQSLGVPCSSVSITRTSRFSPVSPTGGDRWKQGR